MENISIIVAIAENNAIGKDNRLLWHIPADMKHFKEITLGHTVIMGRNTFLSLPGGPLKNRKNIVITDNRQDHFQGCETVFSLEEAFDKCENTECFIIGGASIYRQALPYAQHIYLTLVHRAFEADTFFPELDPSEWEEVNRTRTNTTPDMDLPYTFVTLKRIANFKFHAS